MVIGGTINFLVGNYPHWVLSTNVAEDQIKRPLIKIILSLMIVGLGINSFLLSTGDLGFTQVVCRSILCLLIWTAAIFDIRYQLIPNKLLAFGLLSYLGMVIWGSIPIGASISAGLGAAAIFLLVRSAGFWLYGKAGMGMGDVKLVFLLGLFLQWEVLWAIYLAILLAGSWALFGLLLHALNRGSRLPFAPFLWGGVTVAVIIPYNIFITIWI